MQAIVYKPTAWRFKTSPVVQNFIFAFKQPKPLNLE